MGGKQFNLGRSRGDNSENGDRSQNNASRNRKTWDYKTYLRDKGILGEHTTDMQKAITENVLETKRLVTDEEIGKLAAHISDFTSHTKKDEQHQKIQEIVPENPNSTSDTKNNPDLKDMIKLAQDIQDQADQLILQRAALKEHHKKFALTPKQRAENAKYKETKNLLKQDLILSKETLEAAKKLSSSSGIIKELQKPEETSPAKLTLVEASQNQTENPTITTEKEVPKLMTIITMDLRREN